MDVNIRYGDGFYCDAGPHKGMMAVPVSGRVYMTEGEYAAYQLAGELRFAVAPPQDDPVGGHRHEPLGEGEFCLGHQRAGGDPGD